MNIVNVNHDISFDGMRLPLVLVFVISTAECARILGIFALPFYSHFKLGETLFKELVDRGHEVTVISSFPRKEPIQNYRDVAIKDMNEVMESKLDRTATGLHSQFMEQSTFATTIHAYELFAIFTDASLQSENVQTFLRSNETFDLIILQQFFNEAYLGFMHRFKAPVVLFSSISPSLWAGTVMGSPVPFSYIPYVYVDYPPKMDFWQRMHNSFAHTFDILYKQFIDLPRQNEILHRNFPEAPPLEDLMYNASMMLVNHHSTSGAAVPLQPNIIEIGGFHVQNYQPLSGSLQKFLDEAKEGVVYFSLGSFMRSDSLPEEKIKGILNAFSKLKMKVLWKWEKDVLPGKSSNIRIEKWLSQPAVLAHKNVKLFITHGGRLSIIESIYFGKPILGIPFFADQGVNMREAEYLGYGLYLSTSDLNEENLSNALKEIIDNPKYTQIAQYRSKAFHDLPRTPLDSAIHWIEYAIKYRDLPHLKNASLHLRWFQLLLLDVVLFWLIVLWILIKVLRTCFWRIYEIKDIKLKTN